MGSPGRWIVLKVKGSQLERIRELYKKAAQGVKTSGTQFEKAVEEAGNKKKVTDISKASSSRGKKAVPEAHYDDVLAQIDAKTEELAAQSVAKAPDIRKAKVDAIAEAIKNKTYKFDAEAVAERLLATGLFDDLE